MNKKEQAELASLREELRIARAFRFTEKVEKDVPRPDCGSTSGWDINEHVGDNSWDSHSGVYEAWSECVSHGAGVARSMSGSQGGISLYSTKLLALRALRFALERRFAKRLADVDAMIEKELNAKETCE